MARGEGCTGFAEGVALLRSRRQEMREPFLKQASKQPPAQEAAPPVPGTPWSEDQLNRYADALLDSAGVKQGDILAARVTYPSQLWMADALADAARARGAKFEALCQPGLFEDPDKMPQLLAEDAVFLDLSSFSPSEAAGKQALPGPYQEDWALYNQAQAENSLRWNVAMTPNPEWAGYVYPDKDPEEAYRRLGQDLMEFMRKGENDGEDAWAEHLRSLDRRAQTIDSLGIKQVALRGPGTDLRVGVLPGARFMPVEWDTTRGKTMCVNSPTEEVFTTPDPAAVEGSFTSSKPLVLGGQVITGIKGRVENGELVSLESDDPFHDQLLRKVFLENPGMNKLGELGLVDQTGPIARSGRTFFNNIIDENAGTHLGFGNSYDICLTDEGRTAGSQGNTGAAGHQDIIVGNEAMDVIGIDAQGREIPLIKAGVWQF